MVLQKGELESKLGEEADLIKSGVLRDDNPLDESPEFEEFLTACRHGDLKTCQQLISVGANINGKDRFDYTPLIIASLCGHYELVQLLLEAGALAERNTFQGERCIYNALNDRIRNLLLQYDFSKSSDPYVYWASHISSLLGRPSPKTSDITLLAGNRSFELHKFVLSARSPYFRKKLEVAPDTTLWKLPSNIPIEAFQLVIRYIYLGEMPRDIAPPGSSVIEDNILVGLHKLSKHLEVEHLWDVIMAGTDRRLARQRYEDGIRRAAEQFDEFFKRNVVDYKMVVDTDRVQDVKWKYDNAIFADVLLRADEPMNEDESESQGEAKAETNGGSAIPIGPTSNAEPTKKRKSILYPVHKAMLVRSEYFDKMFSGEFLESQKSDNLHIVTVDCIPEVLELILTFIYTENAVYPLEHALDLLYAADMLFLDKLKTKAAVAISTLGSGTSNALIDRTHTHLNGDGENGAAEDVEVEPINIYDVIHAAWELRVQRLEEFAARYLAYRLEDYIDEAEFQDLIEESAKRLKSREETDTIELLDDIRYYLGERFRLRFEDAGLEDMMDETGEIDAELAAQIAEKAVISEQTNGVTNSPKAEGVEQGMAATTKEGDEKEGEEEGEEEGGMVQTLDGEAAEDEFVSDAINYQILLGKIDVMLGRLMLDA